MAISTSDNGFSINASVFFLFPCPRKKKRIIKIYKGFGELSPGIQPGVCRAVRDLVFEGTRSGIFFCAYAQKKKDLPFQYLCAILKTGNDPGRKTACVLIYPFGLPAFWREVFFRKSSLPAGKRIWIMV